MATILRRTFPAALARRAIVSNPITRARYLSATAINMERISEAIKEDHRELEEAYKNIIQSTSLDQKTRWRNQFTWELARHSIAEELILYPAMEKHLPEGKGMAERDREQHMVVKEHLKTIQNMGPDHPDFDSTLNSLMSALSEHIRDEEEHDLVAMESRLSESDSESMARTFERTKMLTPTRSHPSAGTKPPFETVAGLMAAPIDKIRDLFRKWPEETRQL